MAKLPIDQYMDKVEQASHSQVLAVNQGNGMLSQNGISSNISMVAK